MTPEASASSTGLAAASRSIADNAVLGSGEGMWATRAVGDVPSIVLTDGPHGLRKQSGHGDHLGIGTSVPATCFPPAAGLAQSWDFQLAERVGAALGAECRAENVGVLLGPGVNIRRDPRCGRNFEYYSEDPVLSAALGTAWVSGLQSQGVGASLKHFAANNTETDRMRSSSNVDPRTLREIYLRAFQRVVEEARPWTVMCSYNRINGIFAAENRWLLTEVLRDEWGFDGVVISDWGAVSDRVRAVTAGLDLEMPGNGGRTDAAVVAAAEAGTLDPVLLERSAQRVAALVRKATAGRDDHSFDSEAHHVLAREVAARCVVLLKNEGGLLPLATAGSIAVLGEFATHPRYQGGGSSHVNPTRVDVPLDEIRAAAPGATVTFAPGFTTDGSGDADGLRAEAVAAASAAQTAVVFLGLAAHQESEGFDREHLEIPAGQLALLKAVISVQPRTVVVLMHGGVLRLVQVADTASAILDAALLGQAAGGAIADVLFGKVNPSGRLAETVPVRLEDAPSYLSFPGEHSEVTYGEGLFVGYRGYDARDMAVTYPFGHGLSYTTFDYGDLVAEAVDGGIAVAVTITNTGECAGREVAQFYVSVPGSSVVRPPRELKGFAVADLQPGESRSVSVLLRRQDLAYWDTRLGRWIVEGGSYLVTAGASSRDLRGDTVVELEGDDARVVFTAESTIGEVMADPAAAAAFRAMRAAMAGARESNNAAITSQALGTDVERMMASIPIGRLLSVSGSTRSPQVIDELLAAINEAG
ncbi:glycoside hydrolase family 3 C-terminal domain-containing protein [Streptomyces sp. NPDC097610]|uniref:glycoside hydrolase family 3 C-terminal domain-containing protein n=1 Tax=Streptomyces sp. NPDC097610 TaxID=3157227 RepID=UPI00331DA9E0